LRYPRVGGTREHRFAGTNCKPRKLLENAQTPTRRVHAVLGGVLDVPLPIFGSSIRLIPEYQIQQLEICHFGAVRFRN